MDITGKITKKQIKEACEKSGLSADEMKKFMEFAYRHCITPQEVIDYGYWNVTKKRLFDVHTESARRKKIAIQIAKAHDKDPIDIERQMIEAKEKLGLRIGYFKKYNWDMLTEEQKDGMFLRPYSALLSRKLRLKGADSDLLNDKKRFYECFPDEIGRQWFEFNKDLSYEDFCSKIDAFTTPGYIYKPESLSGGKGIEKFYVEDDKKEIWDILKKKEDGMIEEFIVQDSKMSELCPESVNTVRIVCVYWEGQFEILYAVCRMGAGDGTPVDNISRGGMAAGIDVETGKIDTVAADKAGKPQTRHPATGVKLKGFQIPYWEETLDLVERSSVKIFETAGLGYVGWDIAMTPDGPRIIEGNNWPSPSLIQLCNYLDSGKGMKYLITKYLEM